MSQDSAEKMIVEDYINHYNLFQIDQMINLFSDDCIFENVSKSSGIVQCHGKKEVYDFGTTSNMVFKDRKATPTNWIIGKDKIAVEVDFVGTLALDLQNGPKAGDVLRLKGVSIFEFMNKKIKRLVDYSWELDLF